MEQEQHHHFVFENAYVRAFFVEIPAHDAALYHRHDLPYVNLPPPGDDSSAARRAANGTTAAGLRVSYSAGSFSHAVSNSSDTALQNVAVELLRPQGSVRNRCMEAVRGQPLLECDKPDSAHTDAASHYMLFETDEIAVMYSTIAPGESTRPADAKFSTLVGGFDGIVNVIANGDARPIPQAGLIWLLPGSRTSVEAGKDFAGHFVTIVFKDSALRE